MFDEEANFLSSVGVGVLGRCYGLTTDGKASHEEENVVFPNMIFITFFLLFQGNLITLNNGKSSARFQPPDILLISVETGEVSSLFCFVIKQTFCFFVYLLGREAHHDDRDHL